ncbi:hypothetical protein M427DRAFT_461661 [Gonapodya prolifera JEL478]|uniref:Uncharacterized protein n=1 Tax=Gonapodya prolifera (strain JEL478) TaxID=1344416 RepID=A0A139A218_GONPJ|nr:hypothetical protein M427DRAFT_461661 [Gonapodya prolifera JEL478]|eukprot:KXS10784.1 hypothetical protein M427DRAFT_461661 [Gonapodya prolifera JEL478]
MSHCSYLCIAIAIALLALLAGSGDAAFDSGLIHTKENITFTPGERTLTEPLTIYIIWYRNWSVGDKAIITDFMKGIHTSDFWKINTMYYTANDTNPANRKYISSSVSLGRTVDDFYSLGKVIDGVRNYHIAKLGLGLTSHREISPLT